MALLAAVARWLWVVGLVIVNMDTATAAELPRRVDGLLTTAIATRACARRGHILPSPFLPSFLPSFLPL